MKKYRRSVVIIISNSYFLILNNKTKECYKSGAWVYVLAGELPGV